MTTTAPAAERGPAWLDRSLCPFTTRTFDTPDGRMSYVDEGDGPPVVLVHGTPTWSFLYRSLIAALRPGHRVIAIDHLGFGLSDKPPGAPYRPRDHARRLGALIDSLGLSGITLIVHDFGGPIGLSAALERLDRIERIVVMNSFLWPLDADARIRRGGRIAGSWLGRLLYRHLDFSVKVLLPAGMHDKSVLTPDLRAQYAGPFGSPDDRMGTWAFARALLGESAWYQELWSRRAELAARPMLLAWGMRDPAFGPPYLSRWLEAFPHARVAAFEASGHFVPEEAPRELAAAVEEFIAESSSREARAEPNRGG